MIIPRDIGLKSGTGKLILHPPIMEDGPAILYAVKFHRIPLLMDGLVIS
jgi:hypothetical protein